MENSHAGEPAYVQLVGNFLSDRGSNNTSVDYKDHIDKYRSRSGPGTPHHCHGICGVCLVIHNRSLILGAKPSKIENALRVGIGTCSSASVHTYVPKHVYSHNRSAADTRLEHLTREGFSASKYHDANIRSYDNQFSTR